VGHLKIRFDVRSFGPADAENRVRDPVTGIRRIEVKGRRRGQPIRLTTNWWYKATQSRRQLFALCGLESARQSRPRATEDSEPGEASRSCEALGLAAHYFDIPADAIEGAAEKQKELFGDR
jgi:hypothetical protein